MFLFRKNQEPKGTTTEQIIYAKKLYESSFHPDNGDKQNVFGRMSFQVPGGMLITGAMLQFYRYILIYNPLGIFYIQLISLERLLQLFFGNGQISLLTRS